MCKHLVLFSFFLLSMLGPLSSQAQGDFFIIKDFILEGNKKTKPNIIFQELDAHVGDTVYLKEVSSFILENKKRLLSTALFTDVAINIKNWDTDLQIADIKIIMSENWYVYPAPIFELADRNFNVWWTEQDRDFSRVNYGVSVDHINLTGNKDKLKVKIQQGYTKKYELKYQYPYLAQNWGLFGEIFFANQKEIGYKTIENKTIFERLDDERVLLRRFRTGLGTNYRADVFSFHTLKLEFHHNSIDEYVAAELNPDYFLNGATDLRFFALKYDFTYDRRIFNLYPEGGYLLGAHLQKEGLGIFDDYNNLTLTLEGEKHVKLSDRWIIGGRLKGRATLIRDKIAFANNTGLGYEEDVVRGYELYVVDGTDYVLLKNSIRFKIYETKYAWGKAMIIPQLRYMNTRVFLRFNLDGGFVNEPTYTLTNTLNNRMLIGFGPAVDILLYHTFIASFEYSFNHLGESGLYIKSSFNF